MKINGLIKKMGWVAIMLAALSDGLSAQNSDQKLSVWLNGGSGLGLWDCYDNGTVPYPNLGLAADLDLGLTFEWQRYHFQADTRLTGGLLMVVEGYAVDIDLRLEALYRCYDGKRNRLHLWAGGGLWWCPDIKVLPSMNNASTGTSVFRNLCAEGMVQYDFGNAHNDTHNFLTAYAKLSLPLAGIATRPGFAFMDNYTSELNLTNTLLSDYETFGIAFPGIGTDIGIRFNLPKGNKIGISYSWDYLTTRHKGVYRFDNACHLFNLYFMFNIN